MFETAHRTDVHVSKFAHAHDQFLTM